MKVIYTGLESSGKTLFLALTIEELLKRNIIWEKKYGFTRPIWTNLKLGIKFYEKYKRFIHYWDEVTDILKVVGADIIWDEISSDFSAHKMDSLPKKVNRWLRQGAKQGNHIYATAQEYHDLHVQARRRFSQAYLCRKFLGSERGGENMPPVKKIWGLVYARKLMIHPYNELAPVTVGWPRLLFISKELCDVFDTYQVIEESQGQPKLEHVERKCEVCGLKKVTHL